MRQAAGSRRRRRPGRPARGRADASVAAVLAGLALLGLSACNSASTTGAGITVRGTVLDFKGTPLPQAQILIGKRTAVTDQSGIFVVKKVHTPYDLVVYDAAISYAYVVDGLVAADPVVSTQPILSQQRSANLGGTLGSNPLGSSEKGVIIPGGATPGLGALNIDSNQGPAFGPAPVHWGRPAQRPTTLYAITAVVDASNLPANFTGYGELALTLQDAVDQTNLSVPLQALTKANQGTLSGAFALPDTSYSMAGGGLMLRFGTSTSGAALYLKQTLTNDAFTNAPIPVVPGAPIGYALLGQAQSSAGGLTAAAASTTASASDTLTLPAPPHLLEPASGATTFTAGTVFRWSSRPGSIYLLQVAGGTGSLTGLTIETTATSATLPDLSPLGLQLATATAYGVTVFTMGPATSVLDGASTLWYRFEMLLYEPQVAPSSGPVVAMPFNDGWLTASPVDTLTLQP